MTDVKATSAGTQTSPPDSRQADDWIKNWQSQQLSKIEKLRVEAGGGGLQAGFSVVDANNFPISTGHRTRADAENAANPLYDGIGPNSMGPTAGTHIERDKKER